jgi:hypothetical protein
MTPSKISVALRLVACACAVAAISILAPHLPLSVVVLLTIACVVEIVSVAFRG